MKWPTLRPNDPPADVTLLLEGTYPMVRGGVASWVEQMIRGLPHRRFAIVLDGDITIPDRGEGSAGVV